MPNEPKTVESKASESVYVVRRTDGSCAVYIPIKFDLLEKQNALNPCDVVYETRMKYYVKANI